MSQDPKDASADRFEIRLTSDSHFAWLRTRMAIERTLMAWVRTSIALIGFGFTITTFLARLQDAQGLPPAMNPTAPRNVGVAMIAGGVIAMAISTWDYFRTIRYLWSKNYAPLAGIDRQGPITTPVPAIAVLVIAIGILALASVFYSVV